MSTAQPCPPGGEGGAASCSAASDCGTFDGSKSAWTNESDTCVPEKEHTQYRAVSGDWALDALGGLALCMAPVVRAEVDREVFFIHPHEKGGSDGLVDGGGC